MDGTWCRAWFRVRLFQPVFELLPQRLVSGCQLHCSPVQLACSMPIAAVGMGLDEAGYGRRMIPVGIGLVERRRRMSAFLD